MTYKQFSINLAKQAGKIMLANFKGGMKKQWKKDHSPVTKTDLAINSMVIKEVKKNFPGHDVLGEEKSSRENNGEFLWVCDPVDGTVPFSHATPTFVFSLALVKNGKSILGVIYDPFMDRLFFAEIGKGATLNGKKIKVNKEGLSNSVAGWGAKTMSYLKEKFPNVTFVSMHCICYEGMLVASGEFVAAFYDHVNAHDVAALKVIVEEAGGKVTDHHGKEQRYDGKINGALISNKKVHKDLLKAFAEIK
jgi:fructose-1,6-bisphosphatase/inositol monophosphatase family enzyme